MIYYLAKEKHQYTINVFLNKVSPEAKLFVSSLSYEEVFRNKSLSPGTYIFSDIERLNNFELEAAAEAREALEKNIPDIKLLNHPLKVKRRYHLLRFLYLSGLNDFNVYRLTELRKPEKFPVFIRGENDHSGAETGLIYDQKSLEDEIHALTVAGKTIESRIIVEANTKADENGLYRKYSAFNINGKIIPRHLIFNYNWHVKDPDVIDENTIMQSRKYMADNPHEKKLSEIFSMANIDYGRIDYSIVDGKIQTYEINTNPGVCGEITDRDIRIGAKIKFIPEYLSAMNSIDNTCEYGKRIALKFSTDPLESFDGLKSRKSRIEKFLLSLKNLRI